MAAIPPARTRSLRATAPNLRHPREQQSNGTTGTAPTFNAATNSRNAQPGTAAGMAPSAQVPSPLSLFFSNLRLLDLDLLPDWPGITPATFVQVGSGTGAAQGQKKRVSCVEWVLFRLFEIFDPDEARTKLQPFFPPRDQVQSVNLRAALLRGLEAAKKSGVLGKDTILRKTMLDDCKGERLEDVLAAFSTAVLKMVVGAEDSAVTTPVLGLALEGRGYKDDKTDLMVLAMVHRASLSKALRNKKETAAKYRDFEDLLSVKERGLRRRREEIKALNDADRQQRTGTVSKDAARETRHMVRNNWAGNEKWMETLLYGDARTSTDKSGPFGMPFDRVWRRVEQARLAELEEGSVGLLEQLERRVRGHEERLAKWERFRTGLRGHAKGPAKPQPRSEKKDSAEQGLELGFGAHESLQVGKSGEKKKFATKPRPNVLATGHEEFTKSLDRDLENASGPSKMPSQTLEFLFTRQPLARGKNELEAPEAGQDVVSEISDLDDDEILDTRQGEEQPTVSVVAEKTRGLRSFPVRPTSMQRERGVGNLGEENEATADLPSRTQRLGTAPKLPRPQRVSSHEDETSDIRRASSSRRNQVQSRDWTHIRSRSVSPEKEQPPNERFHDEEESDTAPTRPLQDVDEIEEQAALASPTQDLADDIIESMENASPSPAKPARPRHKLSLADRTRMSMARGSLLFAEEDEDAPLSDRPHTSISTTAVPLNDDETGDGAEASQVEDLASRTRRSMAGFDKARQKAQLDRRRSLRKSKAMGPPIKEGSYFPKVQEEGDGGSMLAEELMAEEDMEAVFRSRPKIQASPIPSPTREWEE